MTDTAVAPALEPQPEAPKQLTREEAVAKILAQQFEAFDASDYQERFAVAKRKNLALVSDPSYIPTLDELKAAVPLKRDRFTYKKLAKNAHGLLSMPKQRGKRKPHLNKHQQSIKSAALRIYRGLLESKSETLRAVCKKEGFEYIGIPESALPALGAQAAKQALREVNELRRSKNRRARRRQQFSRGVNAGLVTTSEKQYVEKGGQFGRK